MQLLIFYYENEKEYFSFVEKEQIIEHFDEGKYIILNRNVDRVSMENIKYDDCKVYLLYQKYSKYFLEPQRNITEEKYINERKKCIHVISENKSIGQGTFCTVMSNGDCSIVTKVYNNFNGCPFNEFLIAKMIENCYLCKAYSIWYDKNIHVTMKKYLSNCNRIFSRVFDIKNAFYNILYCVYRLDKYGFCHNDIKPDNFLLSKESEIVVCDFNLSCNFLIYPFIAKMANTVQTINYRSPEISDAVELNVDFNFDNRTDVFSIGMLILRLYLKDPGAYTKNIDVDYAKLYGYKSERYSSMYMINNNFTSKNNNSYPILEEVKDDDLKVLLQNMLCSNPTYRWNVNKLLTDSYFGDNTKIPVQMSNRDRIDNLLIYKREKNFTVEQIKDLYNTGSEYYGSLVMLFNWVGMMIYSNKEPNIVRTIINFCFYIWDDLKYINCRDFAEHVNDLKTYIIGTPYLYYKHSGDPKLSPEQHERFVKYTLWYMTHVTKPKKTSVVYKYLYRKAQNCCDESPLDEIFQNYVDIDIQVPEEEGTPTYY